MTPGLMDTLETVAVIGLPVLVVILIVLLVISSIDRHAHGKTHEGGKRRRDDEPS